RRLFVEHGYCGVSIPNIVSASGVSTGAIYSYFKDKETLAKEIHAWTVQEFHSLFQQRLTGTESVYEVLKTFTVLVAELTEESPDMMKYMLFMKHGGAICDLSPICSTEPFRLLQSHLRRGIEQGEIRVKDFMLAGLSYTGVILRAAELRMEGILERPLTEVCDILVDNGWNAIKA
nr:TetR/AcrR family transcriptional regulator [Desulfuromusa sp.]